MGPRAGIYCRENQTKTDSVLISDYEMVIRNFGAEHAPIPWTSIKDYNCQNLYDGENNVSEGKQMFSLMQL